MFSQRFLCSITAPFMGKRRLLKLAEFLEALPPEKFKFDTWVRQRGKPMLEALAAGATRCGTVACAVGWMPAVFPKQISWRYDDVLGEPNGPNGVGFIDESQAQLSPRELAVGSYISYGTRTTLSNFRVAQLFFGLSESQSYLLFSPDGGLGSDATPKQVAAEIRRYVG